MVFEFAVVEVFAFGLGLLRSAGMGGSPVPLLPMNMEGRRLRAGSGKPTASYSFPLITG